MTTYRQSLPTLLLAGVLATALTATTFGALAQTPPPPAASQKAGPGAEGPRHHGPARMQERAAKRLAGLKDKLKITSGQEAAWSTFTAALKPPAQRPARPDRAEFKKLTTPERIDRMQALRNEGNARMDQRAAATKTFYAALTPDQKKVFDAESLRVFARHGHRGHHGGHHRG